MKSFRSYLYLLSFLEGASVMICELIGAKMLAPFFGTSLYIWAAALALTLGGLMTGYFFGGILSRKYPNEPRLLYWILEIAGFALVLMPFTSSWIMNATINLSLQAGAIISLIIFMFPPLVFMGMVSPVIINLLTSDATQAGNSAGNVYAISTLGGIIFTFLMGFYIIPEFGISNPAIISGIILAILPTISLFKMKQRVAALLLLVFMTLGAWKISSKEQYPPDYNVIYQSEGILGQLKVVDHPSYGYTDDNRMGRGLIVNNTLQTFVGLDNDRQYSIWSWAHYFPTAASIFPQGSKVLVLGLGGGTLVKQFTRMGFDIDVVEIDKRVWDVSVEYFNVDPDINIIIDDARHYVKTCGKTYDIIVFDTFLSESVPEHLLTLEGFEDTRKILNPEGMVMINFYGFVEGKTGKAARAVLKTLKKSDFITEVLATPGTEDTRNLIFIASDKEQDFSLIDYEEPNFDRITDLYAYFLNQNTIDLSDVEALTDSRPMLSKLYARASMRWKRSYNDYYNSYFFKKESQND